MKTVLFFCLLVTLGLVGCSSNGGKRTASDDFGYLTINANPWGSVYIDDAHHGPVPFVNRKIYTGEHKVELKRDGYTTFAENIEISKNQSVCIVLVDNRNAWQIGKKDNC